MNRNILSCATGSDAERLSVEFVWCRTTKNGGRRANLSWG